MTRYEQGFLTKCAEAGIGQEQAAKLLKKALSNEDQAVEDLAIGEWGLGLGTGSVGAGLVAPGLGAAIGAAIDKKKRLRGALIGALASAGLAGLAGAGTGYHFMRPMIRRFAV